MISIPRFLQFQSSQCMQWIVSQGKIHLHGSYLVVLLFGKKKQKQTEKNMKRQRNWTLWLLWHVSIMASTCHLNARLATSCCNYMAWLRIRTQIYLFHEKKAEAMWYMKILGCGYFVHQSIRLHHGVIILIWLKRLMKKSNHWFKSFY